MVESWRVGYVCSICLAAGISAQCRKAPDENTKPENGNTAHGSSAVAWLAAQKGSWRKAWRPARGSSPKYGSQAAARVAAGGGKEEKALDGMAG